MEGLHPAHPLTVRFNNYRTRTAWLKIGAALHTSTLRYLSSEANAKLATT